ncbi:MAG: sodium/solute symporter [Patescibacteria group bacterium]|nr:sodium/solute symporter [Patescibacteria group bacterium]
MAREAMNALSWIDWTVMLAYAAFVGALGFSFARGHKSTEDYFVGDRRMNWFAVGLSIFAAAFSALSFVLLPREGAFRNWNFLTALLFIPLVITPLLWWVFVPLFTRLGLHSVYEYLEIRFNPLLRRFGALLFMGYAFGWLGSMLYAMGLILDAVLDLTEAQFFMVLVAVGLVALVYTSFGGLKGIVWLDVLQAVTLGGSVVIILLLAIGRIDGGFAAVIEAGRAHDKFDMLSLNASPASQPSIYWIFALGLFVYLPGYTTSQVTVQRYLCMPGLKQARRALAINAVMATVVYFLFMLVGTVMFVYYLQQVGQLPKLASEDQILPYFIARDLRVPGMVGLMVAGLFAAAMSTLDGGINSLTAVIVYDWMGGRKTSVLFSRGLTALIGLGVIGAAVLVPYIGKHVIDMITTVAGTFLGLLLGVYVLGMFSSRANSGGAILGLACGVAGLLFAWNHPGIPRWWCGAFAFLPTLVVGWATSRLFPPPRPEQRRGLFFYDSSKESSGAR